MAGHGQLSIVLRSQMHLFRCPPPCSGASPVAERKGRVSASAGAAQARLTAAAALRTPASSLFCKLLLGLSPCDCSSRSSRSAIVRRSELFVSLKKKTIMEHELSQR